MRMSLASESRQPCSEFSCIDDIRKRPSGLNSTPMCEPAHRSITGCCSAIRAYQSAAPP
jgi:hypothetical protein